MSKKELIEQADYYFFKENFEKAIVLYNTILDNYPRNHYVIYHQYVAHHLTDGRGSDLEGLQDFEKNEGHTDKFYNYWLGRIHHSRYEFDLAIEHFEAFLKLEIYRTRQIIKESENRLNQSKLAQSFYLNANEYEVVLLPSPINSKHDDISPAFFSGHNELLFVSSRPENDNVDSNETDQYRIYHTKKRQSENWGTPNVLDNLGSFSKKNAKIEVVNNDGRLFIYKENNDVGDLFFSEPVENGWSSLKEFDSELKKRKIESHFFINDQETAIYFSSESPSGDLDIFQSTLDPDTKEWSAPVLAFGMLNSSFNEDSPFLSHDSKTLYFSSNRSESIGGYDIFRSEWEDNTQSWGVPINMGFPINTIDDEVNFQLNEDNISGFFSSNRIHGTGKYDIYHFHKKGKVLVSGSVTDESSGDQLKNIQLDFKPTNNTDETFRTTSDIGGNYKKEILQDESYIVEISYNGQIIKTDEVNAQHEELKKSFTKDFKVTVPETLGKKTDFVALYDNSKEQKYEQIGMLGSKFRVGEKAMLKNIYFDIKSDRIKSESSPILLSVLDMMKDYAKLKIQIVGHTDNTGSETLNLDLSKKRAQSVKNYLVKNGISTNRIQTTGYGSKRPIASNDDEKDGRELNRRIEIIAIE